MADEMSPSSPKTRTPVVSNPLPNPLPMHPKTARLLEREQYVQRTAQWFEARRGLLTASDAASALNIKPYPSYRGSPRSELLARKSQNSFVQNMFVVHGQKYEDEARDWAAAAMGETVMDVGLVKHATLDWLGASPDGVTTSGKLVEIKCPLKRAIQPGTIPHHYMPQVQVQMEVCDIDQTIFVQYKPPCVSQDGKGFLDIVVIERDRDWFGRHQEQLRACWEEFMALPPCDDTGPPPSACRIVDSLYSVHSSKD